jgi:hypothetical protein
VHAKELGKRAQVFDFESRAEASLAGGQAFRVVASRRDVIHVRGSHGEDGSGAEDVDARVEETLLPTSVDEPVPEQQAEFAGGLLEAVHAALEDTFLVLYENPRGWRM